MSFEYTIKAIPTEYNGVMFRSRLEATWAAFFDLLKWDWEYEPMDLEGWVPDFVIKGYGGYRIFCEVKPVELTEESDYAMPSAYNKMRLPESWKSIVPEVLEECEQHNREADIRRSAFEIIREWDTSWRPVRNIYDRTPYSEEFSDSLTVIECYIERVGRDRDSSMRTQEISGQLVRKTVGKVTFKAKTYESLRKLLDTWYSYHSDSHWGTMDMQYMDAVPELPLGVCTLALGLHPFATAEVYGGTYDGAAIGVFTEGGTGIACLTNGVGWRTHDIGLTSIEGDWCDIIGSAPQWGYHSDKDARDGVITLEYANELWKKAKNKVQKKYGNIRQN